MNTKQKDYVKNFSKALKSRKVIAGIVIVALVIIGMAQVLGAMRQIEEFFVPPPKYKLTNEQLREQAMQLSSDINYFVEDRMGNEPQVNYNNWQDSMNKFTQYSQESITLYYVKFTQRLADIRQEFLLRNIDDAEFEQMYNIPTNYLGMQEVSQRIAVMVSEIR